MIDFRRFEDIAYSLTDQVHAKEIRTKHFAFLFRRNRIISIGWNELKTTPFNLIHGYYPLSRIHAEAKCLKNARQKNLKHCSIAVLRIDRNNRLNMSAPCQFCAKVLKLFDIEDIYYTDWNGNWIKQINN